MITEVGYTGIVNDVIYLRYVYCRYDISGGSFFFRRQVIGCCSIDRFLLLLWIVIDVSINIAILRHENPCSLVDNHISLFYFKLVSKVGIETEIFQTVGWYITHCQGGLVIACDTS
jgi:hypothetical protein